MMMMAATVGVRMIREMVCTRKKVQSLTEDRHTGEKHQCKKANRISTCEHACVPTQVGTHRNKSKGRPVSIIDLVITTVNEHSFVPRPMILSNAAEPPFSNRTQDGTGRQFAFLSRGSVHSVDRPFAVDAVVRNRCKAEMTKVRASRALLASS